MTSRNTNTSNSTRRKSTSLSLGVVVPSSTSREKDPLECARSSDELVRFIIDSTGTDAIDAIDGSTCDGSADDDSNAVVDVEDDDDDLQLLLLLLLQQQQVQLQLLL